MYDNILYLLNILVESVEPVGYRLKILDFTSKNLLGKALPRNVELALDVRSADIVLADTTSSKGESLIEVLDNLDSKSMVMVLNSIIGVYQYPELTREITVRGFVRSWLPLDGGVTLFTRRGFDHSFLERTIKVYRESFIYGPYPVHYNTAYTLYNLAKFILTRRRGVIVEIGTGRGFSTLWLAHVAKETNSHIVSIDNNRERVEYASKVMEDLKLDRYVKILCCDGREYRHDGRDVVFVFIDGRKDEYHMYLKAIEKYLTPGAIITAHNTLSSAHEMTPYIKRVYSDPYKSITIATDPAGVTITLYKG